MPPPGSEKSLPFPGVEGRLDRELARRTLQGPAEEDPELLAEVEQLVARTNERFSRVEQVKRYAVLSQDWTPDGGEQTPTLKLRRSAIHAKYALVIDGLYG